MASANPARKLAGAGLGRISENGWIPNLLDPEPKSGTTLSIKDAHSCTGGPASPRCEIKTEPETWTWRLLFVVFFILHLKRTF